MQIAALYIRVSTDDQAEYSPDAQKRLLIDYAKKNDLTVSEDYIFIDGGISGRKAEKRPEFMRMIGLAKSKEKPFNKILVWKFSRFARNQEESIVYKNMLKRDGVDVISISEPIIDGPFGSLIERIIEWMDEYYSIRLSGEVMRGMTQKAIKDGVPASPPFGYRLFDGKYQINNEEAEIVRMIFQKVADGESVTHICRWLLEIGSTGKQGGKWHSKRIKYMINNPAYIGNLRWNYTTHKNGRTRNDDSECIIKENTHEAIVDKDLFAKAGEKLKDTVNTKRPVSREVSHYLAGLLRCSECGGTLVINHAATKRKGIRYYYRCGMYNKGGCNSPNYLRVETIEGYLKEGLQRDLEALNNCYSICIVENVDNKENSTNERIILERSLAKTKDKYTAAKNAYLAGIDSIEEYKQNKIDIKSEEENILAKLSKLSIDPVEKSNKIKEKLSGVIELLESDLSPKNKNDFLKSFIKSIIVDVKNDTMRINYYV